MKILYFRCLQLYKTALKLLSCIGNVYVVGVAEVTSVVYVHSPSPKIQNPKMTEYQVTEQVLDRQTAPA